MYGSRIEKNKTIFKVYAPDADSVTICFFDENCQNEKQFLMSESNGDWLYTLKGKQTGLYYGYRVNDGSLLLDPYAKDFSNSIEWDYKKYQSDTMIPCSVVTDNTFDWEGTTHPRIPEEKSIAYEVHVKGFSKLNHKIPENIRGTYAGFAHPESISHLKELGITAVQLLPIHSSMSETRLNDLGLSNYWGYNSISFFAPEKRYSSCKDTVSEFKNMVKELHKNNIEVILDVVYNHTAEGGLNGPDIAFRPFNKNVYLMEDDGVHHTNFSGCGNTINMDDEHTFNMILDSMRYWVNEMQVDGFRFDLAAALGRSNRHFDREGKFFHEIKNDPILSKVKLIAEPWDIGGGGYQVGNFPKGWSETNDKFRDDIRTYWKGDKGALGKLSTRLSGSQDVYPVPYRGDFGSVNMITCHDGFTLHDLVTYNHKHNSANKEDNNDGHNANYSCNYGIEGETKDFSVNTFRNRQKRNMMATLLLSQGATHILGGDEICRTQHGNNNAYCQDNEISWFHWNKTKESIAMFNFTKQMINIRNKYNFLATSQKDTRWFNANAQDMQFSDWTDPNAKAFMVRIKNKEENKRLLILFNASSNAVSFNMNKYIGKYNLIFDTSRNDGIQKEAYKNWNLSEYLLENHSVAMFEVDGFENPHDNC